MTKYQKLLWSGLCVVGMSTLAVVGLSVFSAPAGAGGPDCPAFTTEMVDAAAMAFRLPPGTMGEARDDVRGPSIYCRFERPPSAGGGVFVVDVNDTNAQEAFVLGQNRTEDEPTINFRTQLASFADGLSTGQGHGCRAAVLQSFVWNQYCVPAMQ
jgi:hypothetical protein